MAKVSLKQRYIEQIESWNWKEISNAAQKNCYVNENDEIEGTDYLGSVLNLYPSGKYYMPWCSNQTRFDVVRDSCFQEALEEVAGRYDMYITGSDGDGCDVLAGKIFDYSPDLVFIDSDNADKAEELFGECDGEVELEESEVISE
jgi:hypothetical protein